MDPTLPAPETDADELPNVFVLDDETVSNPQPIFTSLLTDSPVSRTDFGVIIARHEDTQHALRSPDVFRATWT